MRQFIERWLAEKLARRSVLAVLMGVSLSLCLLISCTGKEWDLNDVKHWYDVNPKNRDQCMDFARQATNSNESDKAVQFYKAAIEMAQADEGKDDMRVAQAAAALASLQSRRNLLPEAETYFKMAIPIYEQYVGTKNAIVIENKRYLVDVLMRQGKKEEARKIDKDLPALPKSKAKPTKSTTKRRGKKHK